MHMDNCSFLPVGHYICEGTGIFANVIVLRHKVRIILENGANSFENSCLYISVDMQFDALEIHGFEALRPLLVALKKPLNISEP